MGKGDLCEQIFPRDCNNSGETEAVAIINLPVSVSELFNETNGVQVSSKIVSLVGTPSS